MPRTPAQANARTAAKTAAAPAVAHFRGGFEALVGRIGAASDALRDDALAVVNRSVTARAWITGFYIVEYEQHGRDRAQYGEGLLKKLEKRLDSESFALANLKNFKAFYLAYPEVGFAVADYLVVRFGKGQTASGLLPGGADLPACRKSQTTSGFLVFPVNGGGDGGVPQISPEALFNRLSFSHIVELLRFSDPLQRTFYAWSAIRGTWSVRELRRQVGSRFYERSGWSRDPGKLARLTDAKADRETARESLRAPHVFEFLGLPAPFAAKSRKAPRARTSSPRRERTAR